MKTNLPLLLLAPLFVACSADAPADPGPITAGQGGSAASAGQGGAAGKNQGGAGSNGGTAGSSGAGTSGSGGFSGKAGAAGLGGSGGTAGSSGQGGAGQGGVAGSGGTAGMSGMAGNAGQAGAAGCSATEMPPTGAVFVASSGSDASGDGSQQKPYQSLSKALAAGKTVLVAPGTYTGAVSLPAGVTVAGGWLLIGGEWQRDCSSAARGKVVLTSTAVNTPVVTVDGVKGATLRTLTVKTKEQGETKADQSGESLIGVLVKGDGAALGLEDVEIAAGKAGDGGLASLGLPGNTIACNGTSDCEDGSSGGEGTPGKPSKEPGVFGDKGYEPADGNPGGPGESGKNGTKGGDAQSVICTKCEGKDAVSCPISIASFSVMSSPGKCGCGATGGEEGKPGHGGGASVGLLLSGNVEATVQGAIFSSQQGGKGSEGGKGQLGGQATSGEAGKDADVCEVKKAGSICQWDAGSSQCLLLNEGQNQAKGGTAGGMGGSGGPGGKGSGGTGGPSYAVVKVGGAKYAAEGVTLAHGDGGKGAEGASDGGSGDMASF